MKISISIKENALFRLREYVSGFSAEKFILILAVALAVLATAYFYSRDLLVAYGDAESHLNIAKRVIDSLTPGFAQLGGVWLPLPHIFLIPFVYFDFLWRTGLAGSIVSGILFIISSLFIYKLSFLLTQNKAGSIFAALVFMLNLNILYMQSTPMTEIPLIAFFILSSYYFVKFVKDQNDIFSLLLAAFFSFAAALTRYDGWFLVFMETGIIVLMYFPWQSVPRKFKDIKEKFDTERWKKLEGNAILFAIFGLFGISLWLMWDFLILGDPLYFSTSQFSAKSQQSGWLARGELPAYRNIWLSFLYYLVTSMSNLGVIIFLLAIAGVWLFLSEKENKKRFYIMLLLLVPFTFNVLTLYLGQSVIFIPHITPTTFEWTLFNVRYGIMMVPLAAIAVGYLFFRRKLAGRLLIVFLFLFQFALYGVGYSKIISLEDGARGLSSAILKIPDAQNFISEHYDGGLVLADDFARTISIIRSPIPMKNIIYVGNRPYW